MNDTLIVYFSYTGNTKKVVERIHALKGYDIEEIIPVEAYAKNYQEVVDAEEAKIGEEDTIDIQPLSVSLEKYKRIIIGTPVWWYTCAPAIRTFLLENHLSGKEIIPIVTHGGWLGHTIEDIQKYAKEATMRTYLDLEFADASMRKTQKELDNWIATL